MEKIELAFVALGCVVGIVHGVKRGFVRQALTIAFAWLPLVAALSVHVGAVPDFLNEYTRDLPAYGVLYVIGGFVSGTLAVGIKTFFREVERPVVSIDRFLGGALGGIAGAIAGLAVVIAVFDAGSVLREGLVGRFGDAGLVRGEVGSRVDR